MLFSIREYFGIFEFFLNFFQISIHRITKTEKASEMNSRYEMLISKLNFNESHIFEEWALEVPQQITDNLEKSLIARNPLNNTIKLNFHNELFAILREVHYLEQMGTDGIPEEGLKFSEKSDTYRNYTLNLEKTIEWYNEILLKSSSVELQLIEKEVQGIDELVDKGISELNWNSEGEFEVYFSDN